jgi:hypothetical protein
MKAALQTNPDIVVSAVQKNATEEIRFLIRRWRGLDLFDIRIFARAAVGDMRPTREGCAVNVAKLPEILAAVTEAEAQARRLGLLPGRSE